MPSVTLKAHYDGERIVLDEPFKIEPNARLIVTVLPSDAASIGHADWAAVSVESLARAYSESEPEYTSSDTKPS